MNTDKIPATIQPSGRNEERERSQTFAFQDNRTSSAIQRHLIQAMNGVDQFALPEGFEEFIRGHFDVLVEQVPVGEIMDKQKKLFVKTINNLLLSEGKTALKPGDVKEAWNIFQQLCLESCEEEEEDIPEEEEENIIEQGIVKRIFPLEDAPVLERDNYFIIYRSMSKVEFQQLQNTVREEGSPIFKYSDRGGNAEKFFATSLPYLKAGMSKKGDREKGATVEILLDKRVLPNLVYNNKCAGYPRGEKEKAYEHYGLNPDSQSNKHGIYIKRESAKTLETSNITIGFRKSSKLLSTQLPQYIVAINQLSNPLPDRPPVTNFGKDTKPSDFETQPIGMQPAKQAEGLSPRRELFQIGNDEQTGQEDPQVLKATNESILEVLKGRARAIALKYGLFVVTGEQWLCYIRCVLQALGATDQLKFIKQRLEEEGLFDQISQAGIAIGEEVEGKVQQIIMEVTRQSYHVIALSGDQAALSLAQQGQPIILVLTGAHFSLVQGNGVEIARNLGF